MGFFDKLFGKKNGLIANGPKGPDFIQTIGFGKIYLPAKGKFVQESHYATENERFADGLFPSTKSEKIQAHLLASFEIYKKHVPNADFERVYNAVWRRQWTPANDGAINEYGQGARGSKRPSLEEELWQINFHEPRLQPPVKLCVEANGKKVIVIKGHEIGPGGTQFLGGLTTEVHAYLGTSNDSTITVSMCDQRLPLGPVPPESKLNPTEPPALENSTEDTPTYMQWFLDRIGWHEDNPRHNEELSKGWALTRWCKSYKTVAGKQYAWCGMSLATALHANGYNLPSQPETAYHWQYYGTPVQNWRTKGIPKGAIVIHETSHVAISNRFVKPNEKTIPLLGGNQDNRICIKNYLMSGVIAVVMPVKA